MLIKREFTIEVPKDFLGYGEHRKELPALLARVEVSIDIERIANELGRKAARSKGQRAVQGHSVVKILNLKEKPAQ